MVWEKSQRKKENTDKKSSKLCTWKSTSDNDEISGKHGISDAQSLPTETKEKLLPNSWSSMRLLRCLLALGTS